VSVDETQEPAGLASGVQEVAAPVLADEAKPAQELAVVPEVAEPAALVETKEAAPALAEAK
jgi:hypothetical protein